LCKKYPSAFVYLLNTAESGCWAGASPEMLLCADNQTARTVAIAGTQITTEKALNEYRWTTKEIEEQAIVSDFVKQTLKNAKVEKFEKTAEFNCQAGNLIHLKTAFSFSAKQLKHRGKFLSILHPTPAVCGYGKRAAQDFIAANEKHLRKYYSGFLGILNFDNRTDLFVNLRCAQIIENQIVLYAGAGITAQSVPENEWLETENKLQTLLQII
jgi:isochorismate synthase